MSVTDHFYRYLDELGFMPPPEADIRAVAISNALDSFATHGWEHWNEARIDVAVEQLTYKWTGIEVGEIDGLVGPATRYAREAYAYWLEHAKLPTFRDDEPELKLPNTASPFPKSDDASVIAFYGQPCIQANCVKVPCPWRLKLAWDYSQIRTFLWAHKKCADQVGDVLENVYAHYGEKALSALRLDIFSGDYNPRPMRNSSRWSKHAWGIAWDWDDPNNQLTWGRDRAWLARSEYEDWWKIWEAYGFTSLGRAKNYDWMHVQATSNA